MDFVPLLLHPIVVQILLVEYNVFRSPTMGSGNQGTFPLPVYVEPRFSFSTVFSQIVYLLNKFYVKGITILVCLYYDENVES